MSREDACLVCLTQAVFSSATRWRRCGGGFTPSAPTFPVRCGAACCIERVLTVAETNKHNSYAPVTTGNHVKFCIAFLSLFLSLSLFVYSEKLTVADINGKEYFSDLADAFLAAKR